jgi:hypothetical protein
VTRQAVSESNYTLTNGAISNLNIQSVHKASLQFQKFITKAIDEISSSDLLYVLNGYQSFYHMAFMYVRYPVDE